MKKSHLFNPENVAVLEEEARGTWQDPEEVLGAIETRSHFIAADIGCGSGYFTIPLSRKVRKVYGIDVQKKMLQFLEQKIRKLRMRNVELLLSSTNEIPLGNEAVDIIISINTLHEFDDKGKIIEEMRRVLKPSGRILIVDFKKEYAGFGPPVDIRVTEKQAIQLFERKGFNILETRDLKYHYLLVFSKESSG